MEIALVGNPNVGKSVVFSSLTGVGVISSNYPGTTVEYKEGRARFGELTITAIDLPGIYSLSGTTDDERVATNLLFERMPDTVIAVLDASRLERNLVLLFELLESGYKVVVALNMYDIAKKNHQVIDVERLGSTLGLPVVPTVATKREGMDSLLLESIQIRGRSQFKVRYDSHIEEMISEMVPVLSEDDWRMPLRGVAIRLLAGDPRVVEKVSDDLRRRAERLREQFLETHGEDIIVHIQRDRFGEAGRISREVVRSTSDEPKGSRLSELTMRPLTGLPILVMVIAAMFSLLIFGGGAIESFLVGSYHEVADGFFQGLRDGTDNDLAKGAVEGVYLSIEAMLALVIPYIVVFYIMLSLLEDTGYLVRIVSLLDGVMHRLGLHGRAVIPMVVGYGCNVPAILATRAMGSRRERLILATLITIAVPCSAQTAIIVGTVGTHAGVGYALAIFGILGILLVVLGMAMHRMIKFEPTGLFLEVPSLRFPSPRATLSKTYIRVREFLTIAFPILLAGSIILEMLLVTGTLDLLVDPAEPFMNIVLGLPGVVVIALIFGLLRKEMSLQMLIVLFGTSELASVLSGGQMFVFALVMAIFMPCLAAMAVLLREFGTKNTMIVTAASIGIALTFGAVAKLALGL
ncbi:MAG: ferrous iron transport protein B [Thermoplasmata archaeon]|nr:ferrous iron transport protein B [Thermoplasmata archaeon]